MPIKKFTSNEEARDALRSSPGSEENIRRLRTILEFWAQARPKKIRRGISKYRSVEEAQQDAGK
jgi:hypothetical protein